MPRSSTSKRLQFSTCDACRQSRVSCDAKKQGGRSAGVSGLGSCSRCLKRKRACTFEWLNDAKQSADFLSTRVRHFIAYEPLAAVVTDAEPIQKKHLHVVSDDVLTRWCETIFSQGFEESFGLTLGIYGCPFVGDDVICSSRRSIRQLFRELDACSGESLRALDAFNVRKIPRRQRTEEVIEKAMQCAIRAFAAHWLPLISQTYHWSNAQVKHVVQENWQNARREMLEVINRTSYRSVLALYVFSQNPIPEYLTEDEELDGLSGLVCLQTALSQLQWLRARRTELRSNTLASNHSFGADHITPEYVNLESKAYWAAMAWDTSASLILDSRTSLTSGLKGACSEPTWRVVKSCLVGSFAPRIARWHDQDFALSDQNVEEVIAAAVIGKTYIWKNITSLKEALREGVHDDEVGLPWRALLDAIDIYDTSIRPLLERCEERSQSLSQTARLSLYQVNCQYCLGILMLIDSLNTIAKLDLLQEISVVRQHAERSALNALEFGLDNFFSIGDAVGTDGNMDNPLPLISTTLVGIDPHVQYATHLVLLLHNSLRRCKSQQEIMQYTYGQQLSILSRTVAQLPKHSKLVQEAAMILSTFAES